MSTDKQRTLQTTPTSDRLELDTAFEDAGGLSPADYQKPAPGSLVPKTVGASQSLAVAVNTLVGVVGRNESQLLAALKPNDYQQLVEALETLTAIVGEGKNHFLTPLMDSIDTLIEKCRTEIEEGHEEGFGMKVQNYPKEVRLLAPPQRVNLAELLAQEADLNESDEILNLASSNPELPKEVRLLAPPQRVNLAELLAQEPDDSSSKEVDTGAPVGNEVC